MSWEPWSKGALLERLSSGNEFGSIGPIPVGVRITEMLVVPESASTQSIFVAITVAEQPSSVLNDMVDQRGIFGRTEQSVGMVVPGWLVRIFAGIAVTRRYGWDLEPQVGPYWVNVAFRTTNAQGASLAFTARGFRRVAEKVCRFEKT